LVPEFADVNDRLLPEFFPLEYPRETNGLMAPVTKGLIIVALIGAAGAVVFYLVGRRMSLGRRHST
jgi:hypothetical protein